MNKRGQSSQYPHAPEVSWLSYGSGHVHQVLLGQEAVLNIERDRLHRETGRQLLSAAPEHQPLTLSKSYDAMGRLQDLLVLPPKTMPGQPPQEINPDVPHLMDLSRHHHYNRLGQLEEVQHLRLHPPAQPWQPPQRQTHRSQRYGYDDQHRLAREVVHSVGEDGRSQPEREQGWSYDSTGNRLHPGDARYRALGNRLPRSAQARYRHDAWGNVVHIDYTAGPRQGQQVRLAYDGEHRLLVSERIHTDPEGQRHSLLTRYHYDPMSRRMGKQHIRRVQKNGQADSQTPAPQTTLQITSSLWFGWDGDRMVTMQNDRQASTTIYEPNSFVPMIRVDKQLQAQEQIAQGEMRTYHVHCNHLGTPEALIAQDSLELVWQIELDPWGQTQREYNPQNLWQPFRMQGQQLDQETGLFYNRYRYYDPAGGRYITQDPIGLTGGVNLYGYSNADPVQYFDPFGRSPIANNTMRVLTDSKNNITTVYDPEKGKIFEFETRTKSVGKPGADGPYSGHFTHCEKVPEKSDGTAGGGFGPLKWRTTDPRGRWIHGGGTGLPDPYHAPRQGWKPTLGCTRAQNEDVKKLCEITSEYQKNNPDKKIIYERF